MGRLMEPGKHIDKTTARIMELLNVYDVRKNGVSMVDENGIVDLSVLAVIQDEIDTILRYMEVDLFYQDENGEFYTDENGMRYSSV